MGEIINGETGGGIGGSGTVNTIPVFTPDGETLGDSMFSQNAGGTLGSIGANGMVMGYIQSSATSQNFIDLRNASQYAIRVGNNVSYSLQQNQMNISGASGNSFVFQLVGVGASDRPELVFSKNDNSWQSRIKTNNLTSQHNHFLPDAPGSLAVDNSMTSGAIPVVGSVAGELIDLTPESGTGEATGFTAGAGTSVNDDSTFTGNVGTTAYRISDIVKALKNLGILQS